MLEIIKKPLVTEKNTVHNAQGVYAFEVCESADKTKIKKAIEKAFQVKVDQVRTMVCRDRARRVGKNLSPTRYWKKALVKLAPGEKIKIFEGV
ncbi:MAG: 50S ribosomal protein L23 [Bdellovibrionales bacterium]